MAALRQGEDLELEEIGVVAQLESLGSIPLRRYAVKLAKDLVGHKRHFEFQANGPQQVELVVKANLRIVLPKAAQPGADQVLPEEAVLGGPHVALMTCDFVEGVRLLTCVLLVSGAAQVAVLVVAA